MRQYCRQGTTASDFNNGSKAWPIESSGNGNEMPSIFLIRHDYFFKHKKMNVLFQKSDIWVSNWNSTGPVALSQLRAVEDEESSSGVGNIKDALIILFGVIAPFVVII